MDITLYVNEAEVGPLSLEQVQAMLANGELTMEDFAFFEGCSDWVSVADIPGINEAPVEEAPVEVEAPVEEVAPAEAPAAEAQDANIYIWPEGAEDWAGPLTLSQVQEQLASGELAAESFAAFDGSEEGATVADIPGVYEAPAVADEPAEEEAVEEEAAAPAKKGFGAKKGKGGFSKQGGGGLKKAGGGGFQKGGGGGLKKAGGSGIQKAGAAAKTAGKGKAKAAEKKAAVPVNVEPGTISDKSFGKVFLFASFLGMFGAHQFVTGKVIPGVLKLLLTLVAMGLFLSPVFSIISALTSGGDIASVMASSGMMLRIGGALFSIAGIWQFVDLLMLALGKYKDKQGLPVAHAPQEGMSDKKLGTVLILFWFFAGFAVHRFIAGKIGSAIGFMFTGGGLGIWAILDLISMATGKFTDKEGRPILLTVSE